MEPQIKLISEGKEHRELVEIYKDKKGIVRSRTLHQTKQGSSWVNNVNIPELSKRWTNK